MNFVKISDLKEGDEFISKRIITEEDIDTFGSLSGDRNPIHFENIYTKNS